MFAAADAAHDAYSVVRRLSATSRAIYLTFDDGPDPHWTPRLLDVLARYQARATFFVVGQYAQSNGPLLRRVHGAGHAIGNHAWSHRHPWLLGPVGAHQEIRNGADAVAQTLGRQPDWFRPPHGRLSPWLVAAARAEQQRIALWSVSAKDWGPFGSPDRIVRRLAAVRAGDIVLMHDGARLENRPASTLRALPALLERLQRDGIAPASLPDATLAT